MYTYPHIHAHAHILTTRVHATHMFRVQQRGPLEPDLVVSFHQLCIDHLWQTRDDEMGQECQVEFHGQSAFVTHLLPFDLARSIFVSFLFEVNDATLEPMGTPL